MSLYRRISSSTSIVFGITWIRDLEFANGCCVVDVDDDEEAIVGAMGGSVDWGWRTLEQVEASRPKLYYKKNMAAAADGPIQKDCLPLGHQLLRSQDYKFAITSQKNLRVPNTGERKKWGYYERIVFPPLSLPRSSLSLHTPRTTCQTKLWRTSNLLLPLLHLLILL